MKIKFHTEKRKIKDLIPYESNPRKLTDKQFSDLKRSLEKFDLAEIPVIDTDNKIVAGHQRLMVLNSLGRGEEEIDVRVPNRKLTDEEFKEYLVRSNKNTGQWDWDMLGNEFDVEQLEDWGFDSTELGNIPELFDETKDDDAVPEAPLEPKSKLGDLYILGEHRLLCGDSTDIDCVEKLMGEDKANLWLTDPPYNVAYKGKTKDALEIENDSMEDVDFHDFLVKAFSSVVPFMEKGAAYYIWHADSEGYNFRKAVKDSGMTVRQCLIWVKNTMVMGRQDYQWKHEPCLYGWKDGASHFWNSDRKQTTVLEFDRPSRSAEHPTMKPIDLFQYQLTNSSKQGDIVIDTFLGSGTTLIAAEKTGRKCYGMELDPRYVDVIIKRWEDYTGQKAIKQA